MSSKDSSSEGCDLRRTRELLRNRDRGTLAGWTKGTKEATSSEEGRAAAGASVGRPTLVGSINPGRAFSHNMQGPIPPALDLSSYPAVGEAIQAADELCEKYCALRIEVDILHDENNRLRRMLENLLAKTQELGNKLIKHSPSSPKE